MLKAVVVSPAFGGYGVTFERQYNGLPAPDHMSAYIPCASFDHAKAVAHAFNGVAFTETRPPAYGEPADGQEGRAATSLPATVTACAGAPSQYRGAPMGVADYTAPDVTPQDALHFGIRRVALDEGGYARDGVYWGLPRGTLWHAAADDGGAVYVSRWFRAPTYAHAVQHILAEFPKATTQRVTA